MKKEGETDISNDVSRHQVRVAVRVRPLLDPSTENSVAETFPCKIRVTHEKRSRTSSFAKVFGPKTTQTELFESFFSSSVDSLLRGINVTVIAYGQTGSGKTYTMTGDLEADNSSRGIGPRAAQALFERLEHHTGDNSILSAKVFCTVMQIYNGRVYVFSET